MTSQELVTSKSHTSQDHHGDARSVFERRAAPDSCEVRQSPFPVLSIYFFFKKFQFPFLASLRFFFFCKCNTDAVMSAYKRRLQICFQVGSAAGEQQALVAQRSRRWRTWRAAKWKGGQGERKKEVDVSRSRERERERERERAGERERDR